MLHLLQDQLFSKKSRYKQDQRNSRNNEGLGFNQIQFKSSQDQYNRNNREDNRRQNRHQQNKYHDQWNQGRTNYYQNYFNDNKNFNQRKQYRSRNDEFMKQPIYVIKDQQLEQQAPQQQQQSQTQPTLQNDTINLQIQDSQIERKFNNKVKVHVKYNISINNNDSNSNNNNNLQNGNLNIQLNNSNNKKYNTINRLQYIKLIKSKLKIRLIKFKKSNNNIPHLKKYKKLLKNSKKFQPKLFNNCLKCCNTAISNKSSSYTIIINSITKKRDNNTLTFQEYNYQQDQMKFCENDVQGPQQQGNQTVQYQQKQSKPMCQVPLLAQFLIYANNCTQTNLFPLTMVFIYNRLLNLNNAFEQLRQIALNYEQQKQ
ncbi:unnamed protein product [Paramecium octaurelia]|uniref:Uncharacterized protein n=1 Tax=Paramecium octaurelia TaxID=43137 RepID=A0A8S1V9G1_PAROT|nr:unnamed protein product [Paramecium octaurelia]